jgi:hypothetical protein
MRLTESLAREIVHSSGRLIAAFFGPDSLLITTALAASPS